MLKQNLAAIDCGSNSTRLLLLGPDGETLERLARITRLGAGVDATARLDSQAIDRTLTVLQQYARAVRSYGDYQLRVTATSAVRDALNSDDFLDPAEKICGVRPEVLSGSEEAMLSFRGATADMETGAQVIIVDVGGGSTELAIGTVGEPPSFVTSLALGCVRMTERYLGQAPTPHAAVQEAYDSAATLVRSTMLTCPELDSASQLVAVAGTVTTISAMEQQLPTYDRDRVHKSKLTQEQVQAWVRCLEAETVEQRARHAGIGTARASVILGGAIVVDAVMAVLGFSEMTVSEADILDGLAASLGD